MGGRSYKVLGLALAKAATAAKRCPVAHSLYLCNKGNQSSANENALNTRKKINGWAPQSIFNNAGCLLSLCILRTHPNSSQNTCFSPFLLASIVRSDPCGTRLVESPYPWISAHNCRSCYSWM